MDRCTHAGRLGLGELPEEVAQDLSTTHHVQLHVENQEILGARDFGLKLEARRVLCGRERGPFDSQSREIRCPKVVVIRKGPVGRDTAT